MDMRKNGTALKLKSSKLIIREVIGQLVTPQKRDIIPRAAQNDGDIPSILPRTHPRVAPIKNEGTISPPLKPAPRVIAVKIIFNMNAEKKASPFRDFSIIGIPAPRYSLVLRRIESNIIVIPPMMILK